nr:immunoglobulin heavy chain junction region [Mus musculus]
CAREGYYYGSGGWYFDVW